MVESCSCFSLKHFMSYVLLPAELNFSEIMNSLLCKGQCFLALGYNYMMKKTKWSIWYLINFGCELVQLQGLNLIGCRVQNLNFKIWKANKCSGKSYTFSQTVHWKDYINNNHGYQLMKMFPCINYFASISH